MIKAVLALALCAAFVAAQDNSTTTNSTQPSMEAMLVQQVQQEQSMSRAYIETLLKLQHSQLTIQACNQYSMVRIAQSKRDFEEEASDSESSGDAFLEVESTQYGSFGNPLGSFGNPSGQYPSAQYPNPAMYQANVQQQYGMPAYQAGYPAAASNLGYGGFASYGAQQPQPQQQQQPTLDISPDKEYEFKLNGAFQLLYATKMKFYQAVFRSSDVQNEFWQDRAMQLYVQSAGESVPQELLQLLFIKMYRTNLETLKLSLTFQYISHFVTWLEDELDVNGSGMEYASGSIKQDLIMQDQEDDLIRDRMFAFAAYNSFAQLDFQTFYFDLYLESMMGGGSLGSMGSSMGTSYLEEESTAQFTDILATGSFGAGVGTQPYLFLKVYRFYFLLFQMYAAHSGLTSAYSAHAGYDISQQVSGVATPESKSVDFRKFGDEMLYGQFADNLRYASQMEYVSSLFEMYLLFAPMLSGSFGTSLGSMGSMY